MLNGEIEAWYAQYLYTSRLPEISGEQVGRKDNTDSRRIAIKNLTRYIDHKGNMLSGKKKYCRFRDEIMNIVVPTFQQDEYTADKYPFDYDRPGLENFTNLKKRTLNCL
jgi:hypothetical protein